MGVAPLRTYALPRHADAPGIARRMCSAACHDWGLAALATDCELLVSEVVTNAVVHGTGPILMELSADAGTMHVSVIDRNTYHLGLPDDDPMATSGRGLSIVDALATDWGSVVDDAGTRVWFDITR